MGPEGGGALAVAHQDVRGSAEARIGVEDPCRDSLEEVRLVRGDAQVPELDLGLRPGDVGCALERGRLAVLVGQLQGLLAGIRGERREVDARGPAGGQAHAAPQARDRVEHRARRVGQRAPVLDRAGVADAAAAPQEPRAVGLVLRRADGLSLDRRHVRDPDRLFVLRARPPRGEDRFEMGHELRLDEEVGERGMGPVGGRRRERQLRVRRDFDLARPGSEVRDGNEPDLRVVLRRDHDLQRRRQRPSRLRISTRSSE